MTDDSRGTAKTPYTLKSPCTHCPFRSDADPYLRPERADDIAQSLRDGESFYCHKTLVYDGEYDGEAVGQGTVTGRSRMCAGALITMEREDAPNQIMRIAERLGLYDRFALDMDAPVYASLAEWQESFRNRP